MFTLETHFKEIQKRGCAYFDTPSRAQAIVSLLATCKTPISIKEIMSACNFTSRTSFDRLLFIPAKEYGLIQSNYPQKPRHPQQKYVLTAKGADWLKK